MTAITEEAVAARARQLHEKVCPLKGCELGVGGTWRLYARAQLEHEAAQADRERVVTELRIRVDERVRGADFEDALRWLVDVAPDLVRRALDETGAPA